MSKKRSAEHVVRSVIRDELDDAAKAIKAGDTVKALRELAHAEHKLRGAADDIHRIKEA